MKAVLKQRKLQEIPAPARKLAAEAIGIDSHIDTVQRVLVMGEDLGKRWDVGHVDIPRLREGGTHVPFFALWVPVYFPGGRSGAVDAGSAGRDAIGAGRTQSPDRTGDDSSRYQADR